MRRRSIALAVGICLVLAVSAVHAGARKVQFQAVDPGKPIPPEMERPEGRTRWDLTGVVPGQIWVRTLEDAGKDVSLKDTAGPDGAPAVLRSARLVDPAGGDAAIRWTFPDRYRDDLRPGSREKLFFEERSGEVADSLAIDVETVGVGWVHLPSGPREVALQRVLVTRDRAGRGARTETLVHRWVDPLAGVVAEISGVASADGSTRLTTTDAFVAAKVLLGAADLKIYVDELWQGNYGGLNYGWNKGTNTLISSLTSPSYANMDALIAAGSWNFLPAAAGTVEIGATTTPVNSSETCNDTQCGYNQPGVSLERTDLDYRNTDPTLVDRTNDVAIRDDSRGFPTVWILAGAQHEGSTLTGFNGESRFCYLRAGLPEVPLWSFQHQDTGGHYLTVDDRWGNSGLTPYTDLSPFACEQVLFQGKGSCQSSTPSRLYVSSGCGTPAATGTQTAWVRKGGVITLPSGHTFNALVVEQLANFCVYPFSGCVLFPTEVKTYIDLWQVPHLGSVVMLQSGQIQQPGSSFTTVALTNISFGLYPPLTIAVTGSTETSVTLSWDPGLEYVNGVHHIAGYKVYWDAHSGGAGGYGFNSSTNPGQVTFNGTSATISGLERGTTYYFTVTSLSDYADPGTIHTLAADRIHTIYESLVYPTQVYGDPSYVYPTEVVTTTPCTPTSVVSGLVESENAGGGIHFCWDAVTTEPGACLAGYRLLISSTKQARTGFAFAQDTVGTETCMDFTPPADNQDYFLVVARGSGGEGPRGE